MKIKHTLLAAAALSLLSTTASAVDWDGYFRVGPGQKTNGGADSRCFGGGALGGKGGIGRLGNECDTYGEFGLGQGGEAGGIKYKAYLMTNFYRPGSDVAGQNVGVEQIYAEAKGFDVAPNQTFWIGRRFYGRADVHMDDTFFVNMSGSGAGVDGIGLGGASLNAAVFRTSEDGGNPGTRLNVDMSGLAVNPGGKLRVTAAFTDFSGTSGEAGYGLSLQHNQTGVFGGENTLWLQMAQGSTALDMGFGTGIDDSDRKRWRIVDSLTWATGALTAQTLLQFGKNKTTNTATLTDEDFKFNSIAARVAFAFTKNFKLQGELGSASRTPDGGDSQRVTKFTVAPTLTVGPNFYDRPELRLYVSTFNFNDAYRAANGLTKSSKTAVGFQAEMWF